MTTWGPSGKKPSKKSSGKRSTACRSCVQDVQDVTQLPIGDAAGRSATQPRSRSIGRRRWAQAAEHAGRHNDELIGLGLIGAAVLLGLAFYVDLAGPIGRGVETLFGWFFGLGRIAVPVVLGRSRCGVRSQGSLVGPDPPGDRMDRGGGCQRSG